MKTIVAGSRNITDYRIVQAAIEKAATLSIVITELVSGAARGVDSLGERWAEENGIPIKRFPADWAALGKSAGHVRNAAMAEYAEALIAVWDGASKGTSSMIEKARAKDLAVYIFTVNKVLQ